MIRFCEFCSAVHHKEATHCSACGARLVQAVSEEQFNDPANPWPFVPASRLCLRIQGQPRYIQFSGTHSVYHFWTWLYEGFRHMRLWCRIRKGELELAVFPDHTIPEDRRRVTPDLLLNCWHRRFSLYTYQDPDPALNMAPGQLEKTYQGSFVIEECPVESWGNVLGWLVGTAPRPEPDNGWTYDI